MELDFQIQQEITIFDGRNYFDLHNDFFTADVSIHYMEKKVVWHLLGSTKDYSQDTFTGTGEEISIVFEGVNFVDTALNFDNAGHIRSLVNAIGFQPHDDPQCSWFAAPGDELETYYFVADFMSGDRLRVGASSANFRANGTDQS
ncbi:MAG: hypothetical protein ACFB0Z_02285 [Candidatus Phaeomarinobacter sp.]